MTDLLPVRGSPGSPYTRKMLALLRYRRTAYRFLQGAEDVDGLPRPKVGHSERLLLAGPMDRSGSILTVDGLLSGSRQCADC
jgi:hypothetical protein